MVFKYFIAIRDASFASWTSIGRCAQQAALIGLIGDFWSAGVYQSQTVP